MGRQYANDLFADPLGTPVFSASEGVIRDEGEQPFVNDLSFIARREEYGLELTFSIVDWKTGPQIPNLRYVLAEVNGMARGSSTPVTGSIELPGLAVGFLYRPNATVRNSISIDDIADGVSERQSGTIYVLSPQNERLATVQYSITATKSGDRIIRSIQGVMTTHRRISFYADLVLK